MRMAGQIARADIPWHRCAFALAATWLLVQLTGCAYFNLFYNARKVYEDAQTTPSTGPADQPSRQTDAKYDQVIEKCQKLIRLYPDSKWVDDSILLMGKSYYYKGEYDESITKLNELEENFPDSDLNEEAALYLGKAYSRKGEPERAIHVLERMLQDYPKTRYSEEVLYIMGTSAIKADLEDDAVRYLGQLAEKHPKSEYRVEADLEIAEIFVERERYDRALEVFDKLGKTELEEKDMIRYKMAMLAVYVKIGRFANAIGVARQLDGLALDDEVQATRLLYRGEAQAGIDSVRAALSTFQTVRSAFPRSKFSAEAAFRMGVIYQERLDSLDVAAQSFDAVPRQYSKSDYASEAIKRSSSIKNLKRLRASLEGNKEENKAAVQFDLAEVELFQFDNHEKALGLYQQVLADFPDSPEAPKAAYAVAYIYEAYLKDETQARLAYQRLVRDYPESQQAEYARDYLGMGPRSSSADSILNESTQ